MPLLGRIVFAVAAALLMAVVVVRNALVAHYAEIRPSLAAAAWPDHPDAELWSGLTGIAAAARTGQPVSRDVIGRMNNAAERAPLAATPFLVRGVQARLSGDEALAGRAFLAAEVRDGRSVAARYFLADHDLRTGNASGGLREIAVLARMIPNGVVALSPFVAGYAQDPRNWSQLQTLFRSDPLLADATLTALAANPGNSGIVLRLAGEKGPPGLWANHLIATLVTAKEYAKAYDVWRRIAHVPTNAEGLIYDPNFREAGAPAPFNWALTSSALGLAERQGQGRLHVIYYGQDNGPLATQLLVLNPGRYHLQMRATGDPAGSLAWTISCENDSSELTRIPVTSSMAVTFVVPAGCPAQRLTLKGTSADLPRTAEVTISGLKLTRVTEND